MRALAVAAFLLAASGALAQPWQERETAMQPGGILDLRAKPWWPRAQALKVGEQFILKSAFAPPGGPGGLMLVRREPMARPRASAKDMIVWILDDDGDMDPTDPRPDTDSDCYVVDYDGDGLADRMVDYIDPKGAGPREMDIRYFEKGELRRAWFWTDWDGDGKMWDLADYEYSGDCFKSDPYGDNDLYMNKYDPETNSWLPISECPFAFYGAGGPDASEAVVRFSAAPLGFDEEASRDYANDAGRYDGPFDPAMRRAGVVNIRYSVDLDGLASPERPLHYDMGFTMTGALPYDFPGMHREQPLRREPKITVCVPHKAAREVAETYPADRVGLTWREFYDAELPLGAPPHPERGRRWEGVFWTWQRHPLHNTGGPVQEWNVRREYRPTASTRRELYFSPVDRRIHLKGAQEGWTLAGHLGNAEPIGEWRMFDLDGDGYFDRWEFHAWEGGPLPSREATVSGAENRDLPADWGEIRKFYNGQALPEAIALDEEFLDAFTRGASVPLPGLGDMSRARDLAGDDASPEERRYVLDVARELVYGRFRADMQAASKTTLWSAVMLGQRAGARNPKGMPWDLRFEPDAMRRSERAWELARRLAQMDEDYGAGRLRETIDAFAAMEKEGYFAPTR